MVAPHELRITLQRGHALLGHRCSELRVGFFFPSQFLFQWELLLFLLHRTAWKLTYVRTKNKPQTNKQKVRGASLEEVMFPCLKSGLE